MIFGVYTPSDILPIGKVLDLIIVIFCYRKVIFAFRRVIFGVCTPSDILPIGKVLDLIIIVFKGLDTSKRDA